MRCRTSTCVLTSTMRQSASPPHTQESSMVGLIPRSVSLLSWFVPRARDASIREVAPARSPGKPPLDRRPRRDRLVAHGPASARLQARHPGSLWVGRQTAPPDGERGRLHVLPHNRRALPGGLGCLSSLEVAPRAVPQRDPLPGPSSARTSIRSTCREAVPQAVPPAGLGRRSASGTPVAMAHLHCVRPGGGVRRTAGHARSSGAGRWDASLAVRRHGVIAGSPGARRQRSRKG